MCHQVYSFGEVSQLCCLMLFDVQGVYTRPAFQAAMQSGCMQTHLCAYGNIDSQLKHLITAVQTMCFDIWP